MTGLFRAIQQLGNGLGGATDPSAGASAVDRVILNVSGLAAQSADPTVPGYIGIAYVVRVLLPGLFRRMTARARLPVLPDLES